MLPDWVLNLIVWRRFDLNVLHFKAGQKTWPLTPRRPDQTPEVKVETRHKPHTRLEPTVKTELMRWAPDDSVPNAYVCVCVCVCVPLCIGGAHLSQQPNIALLVAISAEPLKDREGILIKVLHERWPSSVGLLVQRE